MSRFEIDNVMQLRWLVAATGALAAYGFAARRRALRSFAAANLLGALSPDVSGARQYVKAALVVAAMIALVFALTGPRYGAYFEKIQRPQLDLMICLDVSRSMMAEDAGMSRLDRAKDDIRRLLEKMTGGQIGLVCFAGRGDPACPLTDDYDYYRLALDDVGIHSAPRGGTNIGDAIDTAVRAFGGLKHHRRAVILMTDGEDHEGRAAEEAKKALDEGISVFAIGIGDEEKGGLVPVDRGSNRSFLMYDGQQVWSKLDPATLTAAARAGGGEYHPSGQVNQSQRTLEWIYSDRLLGEQEMEAGPKRKLKQQPRFVWPAAMALALLLIEPWIKERRGGVTA
jgi:Ca-activated chloride channel family protein